MKKKIKNILFPLHPLSNIDIEEYFKLTKIKGKVYPRDRMPKTLKPGTCMIINLGPAGTNGTHWVSAINSKNEKSILYYDSFGVHFPPEEFLNMKHGKPIVANDSQHQMIDSFMCGYFCLKVCKSILKDGMTYQQTMEIFSDNPSNKNENLSDDL